MKNVSGFNDSPESGAQKRGRGAWNKFNDPTIDGKVVRNVPEGERANVRESFMPFDSASRGDQVRRLWASDVGCRGQVLNEKALKGFSNGR